MDFLKKAAVQVHEAECGEGRLQAPCRGLGIDDLARLPQRFHTIRHHSQARGQRSRRRKTEENWVLTSGDMDLLTGPHQTSFLEESSSTIRLSEGERPVLAPEYAESAPVDVIADPDSYTSASS